MSVGRPVVIDFSMHRFWAKIDHGPIDRCRKWKHFIGD